MPPEVADLRSAGSGFSLPECVRLHLMHRVGELRGCEHLRQSSSENRGAPSPIPSALHPIPAATTASADSSRRVATLAFQP